MPNFYSITTEIVGAAATLAGLILVFLGATVSGYERVDPTQRKHVVKAFRSRGWSALWCFLLALGSTLSGLMAKLFMNQCWSAISLSAFVACVVWIAIVAVDAVRGIS